MIETILRAKYLDQRTARWVSDNLFPNESKHTIWNIFSLRSPAARSIYARLTAEGLVEDKMTAKAASFIPRAKPNEETIRGILTMKKAGASHSDVQAAFREMAHGTVSNMFYLTSTRAAQIWEQMNP